MPVAAGPVSRPTNRCCFLTASYFFAWGAERACGLFVVGGEGGYRMGAEEENPVVPLGTWRWRISIIAGIKAGASFLRPRSAFFPFQTSYPPCPVFRSPPKGPFSAHNRDQRVPAWACPDLNRDNFCVTFLRPAHTSICPFSFAFSYLLLFYKNRPSLVQNFHRICMKVFLFYVWLNKNKQYRTSIKNIVKLLYFK